ncbi:NAD(P)H-dependent oxidoreductase [Niabella drilacis]|uniref:Modulator of drug activity B n=1 Tax=Niabella drilacis (strain DSM 25811 / CCM 8410 / CCUG 62505 / LMG 26954 / E90) TaxID=1285928 RepID=A0A1G6I684_NIADE|nr:NAD(P)H-dependent oxidoreductase [Niabella drilacis]SDC01873.1 modulator of drug activity B [Niabella drilacis]
MIKLNNQRNGKKTVLLINAHLKYPNRSEGKLNASLQEVARDYFKSDGYLVLETKVEDGYDPVEEVRKHLQADIIILQTPINWFGAPWIYKKYADELFEAGHAKREFLEGDGRSRQDPTRQYGSGGKLHGKRFMVSATWNAPGEAFGNSDQNLMKGKTTADLLLNITSNYAFCGAGILPGFNSFDVVKNGTPKKDLENYRAFLANII